MHANAHKTTNGHLMEWMTVIFAGSILLDENFGLVDDNRIQLCFTATTSYIKLVQVFLFVSFSFSFSFLQALVNYFWGIAEKIEKFLFAMSKIQKKLSSKQFTSLFDIIFKLLKKRAFYSQILNLKFPFPCNPYIQKFSSMILSIVFTYFLP